MSQVNEPRGAQQQQRSAASGELASGELASDVEGLSSFEDNRASASAQLKLANAIATSPPMVRQQNTLRRMFGETAQLQERSDWPQPGLVQQRPAIVQRGIAPGSEEVKPGGEYDKPQQNVGSTQIVKLYGQAWEAQGELFEKTKSVASATGGRPSFPPGLKDLKTSKEKVAREYDNDASKIVDLVRSTIVYKDVRALLAAMPEIQSQFTIARLKNKFMNVTPSGYRDININVQMSNGHIGELQVNLEEVLALKEAQHKEVYEQERAEMEKRGKDKATWPPEVVEKLENLEKEWRPKFEAAMAKAGGAEDTEKLKGIKEVGVKKK